jgi:hypothetical protein
MLNSLANSQFLYVFALLILRNTKLSKIVVEVKKNFECNKFQQLDRSVKNADILNVEGVSWNFCAVVKLDVVFSGNFKAIFIMIFKLFYNCIHTYIHTHNECVA